MEGKKIYQHVEANLVVSGYKAIQATVSTTCVCANKSN